jgi:hypothetical protein
VLRPTGAALVAVVLAALVGCTASSSPVTADDYSEQDLLEMRASSLEMLAAALKIDDPPEVALIRFVARSESGQAQAECLGELGIAASATSDGSGFVLEGTPQESQADATNLAIYTCVARYTVDPRYNVELSSSQYAFLYRYFVNELTPCLRNEGYVVQDAPSLETFSDTYAETGWSPYSQDLVASLDEAQLNKLFQSCPQLPPDSDLYPFEADL